MSRTPCLYCDRTLEFLTDGRGWRHRDGGFYVQRCDDCGFVESKSPPAIKCPSCGSERGWKDDHAALPKASR